MPTATEFVERFVEADFAHWNDYTTCLIWDGPVDRKRNPIMANAQKTREFIWQAEDEDRFLARGDSITARCENPLCIAPLHLERVSASEDKHVSFTVEQLATAEAMRSDGYRLDRIAEKLDMSVSRVSRMLKAAREATP